MAHYGYGGGNFSTTTYGAQGGADGGGFLGGSQMGSQNSSGSKSYGKDTLRPVTIKQITEAPQSYSDGEQKPDREFKVDGVEATQITIIGQIQSISPQATNTTYQLDDGTGIIDVKQWSESDVDSELGSTTPKENDYLRVWGRLKVFNNKRHIVAHMIRIVTDYNEVCYHLLEATAIHLFFTRGPPPSADIIKNEGSGMFVDKLGGGSNALNSIPPVPAGKRLAANTSPTARKIYALLLDLRINEGLHVSEISQKLGIQIADAIKAGDELLGTGAIYTTVDDETWAVLEY